MARRMNRLTARAVAATLSVALAGVFMGCETAPSPPDVPVPGPATVRPDPGVRGHDYAPGSDNYRPGVGVPGDERLPARSDLPVPSENNRPLDLRQDPTRPQVQPPRPQAPTAGTPDTRVDTRVRPNPAADATLRDPSFVDAYKVAGEPGIAVYVVRTTDGKPLVAKPLELTRPNTPAASGAPSPAAGPELVTIGPGQSKAPAVDFSLVENTLLDGLYEGGAVKLVPPAGVRDRVPAADQTALDNGDAAAVKKAGEQFANVANYLVHVTVHPAGAGGDLKIDAQVVDFANVTSFATASIDLPASANAAVTRDKVRQVAMKLKDDLTGVWTMQQRMGR